MLKLNDTHRNYKKTVKIIKAVKAVGCFAILTASLYMPFFFIEMYLV